MINGNFMWAVENMREGNKVTRLAFEDGVWCECNYPSSVLCAEGNIRRKIGWSDYEANDWVLFFDKQKATLSDKIHYDPIDFPEGVSTAGSFTKKDVKEALAEFMKYFDMSREDLIEFVASSKSLNGDEFMMKKAIEIFGKDLL